MSELKIQDKKLKTLLIEYTKNHSPTLLLLILDYKGIKLNKNSIDAVIVKAEEINGKIELGGIIIDGILYKIIFDNGVLIFYHDSKIEL